VVADVGRYGSLAVRKGAKFMGLMDK
jgi:hypothetical protein